MRKRLSRVVSALFIIFFIIIIAFGVMRALFPRAHIEYIKKYSHKFGVDSSLVLALIKAESNFNTDAVSHANAKGIMQLTEETFEFCNDTLKTDAGDILSPEENIRAGVWYLSYLIERYNGSCKNALAAYNAGATNVDKWLSDSRYSDDGKTLKEIPFGKTYRHTEKITRYKIIYDFLY